MFRNLTILSATILAACSGEPSPPFAQLYRIGSEASPFKGYIVSDYGVFVQFRTCEGNVIRIERSELKLERGKC